MIKLKKLLTVLIISLAAASCGSGGKEFGEFLDLFPDIGQTLTNDEEILFPLNSVAYDSLIKKLPNPVPARFKKYIHMEDSAFLFYGNTLAQFGENLPYYPIYKISANSFHAVVVYYTAPEIPGKREKGVHYLLFTYTSEGNLIDAYALAFSGTDVVLPGTAVLRYTQFYQLDNIKVITARSTESSSNNELVSDLRITNKGEIKESPERLRFEDFIGTWVLAEQNGPVTALKECDKWIESLNFQTNDYGGLMIVHGTAQMAIVYDVGKFSTNPEDDKVYFTIYSQDREQSGAGSFYYDDPEHITIKIEGYNLYREDVGQTLFVKEAAVDNGSIQIKALPCQEEP